MFVAVFVGGESVEGNLESVGLIFNKKLLVHSLLSFERHTGDKCETEL